MPSRLVSLIALLCLSSALHAQSEAPARYQVYGGYSYLSNSINGVPGSRQPLNGWDASLAFFSWHGLRFKLDTYAYRGTNLGAPQHPLFIMGGGQYNWRIKRESVFVEGLLGEAGMNSNWGANQTIGYTASISTLAGGGLDTPLSRHISFRVSGGFQYAYFNLGGPQIAIPYRPPGLPTYFGRISSGLVWQF
jgi:hypothetical protein